MHDQSAFSILWTSSFISDVDIYHAYKNTHTIRGVHTRSQCYWRHVYPTTQWMCGLYIPCIWARDRGSYARPCPPDYRGRCLLSDVVPRSVGGSDVLPGDTNEKANFLLDLFQRIVVSVAFRKWINEFEGTPPLGIERWSVCRFQQA